ncbi:MAG: hypothetical protein HC902_14490 [Calothrix sp. SM1_5_4]|nr:hypothetical protein [Calothrix sp. SM1_5_4]
MTEAFTLDTTIFFHRSQGKQKQAQTQPEPQLPTSHLPRITKLMALAIRLGKQIDRGIQTHAEIARNGEITRARISQILNLLHLAPDIQQAILFLPPIERGRARLKLLELQKICTT